MFFSPSVQKNAPYAIKTLSKKNQPLFLFLKEKRLILCGEKSATQLSVISPA